MMRRVSSGCASLLALTSISCATVDKIATGIGELGEPVTAEWTATNSVVEHDEYRQSTSLRAPSLQEKIGRGGSYYRAHLRGLAGKNGAESFQLYVATHLQGEWHNLRKAVDQDGIALAVSKVSRKKQCGEDGCVYYEHFAVALSRDYLETRQREGIELVVSGPGHEVAVTVPAVYLEGFLRRFAGELAARRRASGGRREVAKLSYCEAKYGSDARALDFCQQQARASYQRLQPALSRTRSDSFTGEARLLESCMRRHNGSLGIDWMMVEHCYGKGTSSSRQGPASR